MNQLTHVQENLKRIVENYRQFFREFTKYKTQFKHFEMTPAHKKDWETHVQQLNAEMNVEDYKAKLNLLENSIFKICRSVDKNKIYTNLFSKEIDVEFVESLGLKFSKDKSMLKIGDFYTFYIDGKRVFSRFELNNQGG